MFVLAAAILLAQEPLGQWSIHQEADGMTGAVTHTAVLASSNGHGGLTVSCSGPGYTAVTVVTREVVGSSTRVRPFRYRFDADEARQVFWRYGPQAVLVPAEERARFVERLSTGGRLRAEMVDTTMRTVGVDLDTTGAAEAVASLRRACDE